jgi:ornithine cyclodeaminase/alanine dehydrogenase-like protein (mu-crystallin family)
MHVLSAEQIMARLPMRRLIESLRLAFGRECFAPVRQVAKVPGGAQQERLFLCMPAFDSRGAGAVKLLTVFPDNVARGLANIQAVIVAFSEQGTPLAVLDGTVVTRMRTGAASALASSYLSREDSAHLVIIGSGSLAPYMALAHCAVRPIRRVSICARSPQRGAITAAAIRSMVHPAVEVGYAESTAAAVVGADIVCCATSSPTPVLRGEWLAAGAFVDLVGSFSATTREADDAVVQRSRIFVDTFAGAMAEAGDILDPLARGVIDRSRLEGELADLVCARAVGRKTRDEITLFKSVGTAIEDLAAAQMLVADL